MSTRWWPGCPKRPDSTEQPVASLLKAISLRTGWSTSTSCCTTNCSGCVERGIDQARNRWPARSDHHKAVGREVIGDAAHVDLSLIHISEPTRRTPISYAVFCLK